MIDPKKTALWRRRASLAATLMLAALPNAVLSAAARIGDRHVADELIVGYRSAIAAKSASTLRDSLGLQTRLSLDGGRVQVLRLPAITSVQAAGALLAADPAVAYVEPNFIRRRLAAIPNDPLFDQLWGLLSTGQANFAVPADDPEAAALASKPGADMNMPAAWDRDGDGVADRTGDGSVLVAVIDDAFDVDHEDLAANFVAGADLTTCSAQNLDGCNTDVRPDQNGLLDHGTLVAGSLGAVGNNGIGVAGTIWDVRMMPLKVGRVSDGQVELDSGSILAAYEYARTRGAKLVNASYGGPSCSQAEYEAIRRLGEAGILFVTSAGNFNSNLDYSVAAFPANYREGGCTSRNGGRFVVDPSADKLDNIVTVAATNRQDNIASFSQFGPVSADISAPGLQIVTTLPGNAYVTGDTCLDGGTCGTSGTSFASPYAAGIAALMLSENPQASMLELKARLIEGAEAGVDGGDAHLLTAGGRLDAAASLDLTPRPSLVLRAVSLQGGDGNGRLDAGETLAVQLRVENLWQTAIDTQARLLAPTDRIRVLTGPQTIPTLAQGESTTLSYSIEVLDAESDYEELGFWLELGAAGGYQALRPFRAELAELALAEPAQGVLSLGLHDEFHTYHLDVDAVPAGQRLVVCTRAQTDIDVLVKYGAPAQYDIDLGADPEDDPTFFTDADTVAGEADGNEAEVVANPRAGTYYLTVVNFDLTESLDYTLAAFFEADGGEAVGAGSPACIARQPQGGGGGGALSPGLLATLAMLAFAGPAVRRRRRLAAAIPGRR
ncbi:S8 family serine peptidase [Sinimarinibacterium flocculans]|uniref:S8 family serine peptidase n=1 Tax=Sinimarinibacterium flocculans TaxID=985250 RepID=UPI00248F9B06|nr:S8 family serine peptidase [Sinimarinibacterium flocculans]